MTSVMLLCRHIQSNDSRTSMSNVIQYDNRIVGKLLTDPHMRIKTLDCPKCFFCQMFWCVVFCFG